MRRLFFSFVLLAATIFAGPAFAAPSTQPAPPVERRIAIGDGRVPVQALLDTIGVDAGLDRASMPWMNVDLSNGRCATFCRDLAHTLGEGCSAKVVDGTLCVSIDRARCRQDHTTRTRVTRILLNGSAVRPAADGYGLALPKDYDPAKPLVLLIHGLASDNDIWGSMVKQLAEAGHQVGYFRYCDREGIGFAGDLLADDFADLRLRHPRAQVKVLAHSMGGLVARHYVEGPSYQGGIDRIVMLGTPNGGSPCANWRWALDLYQRYYEKKNDPAWTMRRAAVECNGNAGEDLQPGSKFLTALNARPRRDGVKYTVVAGNRNAFRNAGADWVAGAGNIFPDRANTWVGVSHLRWALNERSKSMRAVDAESDGVVAVDSAKLAGVEDFVVINADHVALACGYPPAAWDVVRERLK